MNPNLVALEEALRNVILDNSLTSMEVVREMKKSLESISNILGAQSYMAKNISNSIESMDTSFAGPDVLSSGIGADTISFNLSSSSSDTIPF